MVNDSRFYYGVGLLIILIAFVVFALGFEKRKPRAREIVMLVGNGCKWRKCRFCDYHLDSSPDKEFNYKINKAEYT